MIGLLGKLKERLAKRYWPYWCPFCTERFRDKQLFEVHYLADRKAYLAKRERNRAYRKVMSEKASRLKVKRKAGRK